MTVSWEDRQFMSEAASARLLDVSALAHLLLIAIVAFFAIALYWAKQAELDEVTAGSGKVIPSGQVRLVQSLEGGILSALLVTEGEVVTQGQILLHIDDTQFQASYRESHLRYLSLAARAARLEAEAGGLESITFPEKVLKEQPELVANEKKLWTSSQEEIAASIGRLTDQIDQRKQELVELQAAHKQIRRRLDLLGTELKLTEPMVKQGIMSEVELLRLRREVAKLEGELENATLTIPRVSSLLKEAQSKAREPRLTFRNQAQSELNKTRAELQQLAENITGLKDRVTRSTVRAPVNGTVIRVRIHTIGQVIRSGMDLVEIMPLDEALLVEARIRPADIAFLRPGQETMVKFTAYDFSIYGGLKGTLTQISADAITDEKGENFYKIQVRTQKNHLGNQDHPLPIIPGMVATTHIITGKKTVLDYLLKPILKVRANALRER